MSDYAAKASVSQITVMSQTFCSRVSPRTKTSPERRGGRVGLSHFMGAAASHALKAAKSCDEKAQAATPPARSFLGGRPEVEMPPEHSIARQVLISLDHSAPWAQSEANKSWKVPMG